MPRNGLGGQQTHSTHTKIPLEVQHARDNQTCSKTDRGGRPAYGTRAFGCGVPEEPWLRRLARLPGREQNLVLVENVLPQLLAYGGDQEKQ